MTSGVISDGKTFVEPAWKPLYAFLINEKVVGAFTPTTSQESGGSNTAGHEGLLNVIDDALLNLVLYLDKVA
jgi:hypothetical protein